MLSRRIFEGIGVWDKYCPQIATYRQVRLSDADHPGVVEFQPADLGTARLCGRTPSAADSVAGVLAGVHECLYLCPAEVVKLSMSQVG